MSAFSMIHRRLLHTVGAAALVAATARPIAAQAPATFHACFVPTVGAVYLIGLAGLSSACLAASHGEISWSESGGVPADGSITTQKLADGAVTTPKLATNSVGSVHVVDRSLGGVDLAAGAVGSNELANGAVTTAKLAAPLSIASFSLAAASGLATTPTNLGSVTLNVPASGKVLLQLSGYAVFFGDNTMVAAGLGSGMGLTDLHSTRFGRQDGSGTSRYTLSFQDFAVVNVAAGTRTFFATAYRESVFSANSVNLADVQLTAFYIPN